MNVTQAQQDIRNRVQQARDVQRRPSGRKDYSSLNARTPVPAKNTNTLRIAGGGELELPKHVNKNIVNDALIAAIDKEMAKPENAALKGRQVMLENKDPKARLTKAPKSNLMISGFTLAGVADHGVTNIHYHNASGKIAGSKYGQANYTASGTTNFDHTETTGHFSMKYVGDNNSMKNSNVANLKGELAAQSSGTNIKNGDYGVKGTEAALSNSSFAGRHNEITDIAQNRKPGAPAIVLVHSEDPRVTAQREFAAKKDAAYKAHLQMGIQATSGSSRIRKLEAA